MSILVTGASGFVGRAFLRSDYVSGNRIVACGRGERPAGIPAHIEWLQKPILGLTIDDLKSIDSIVHLAALSDTRGQDEEKIFFVNASLTDHLSQIAAASGVKKFIFLSSCKAIGEHSITSSTEPNPETPYGRSKLAAEVALEENAQRSDLKFYIVRPAPVYGPHAKGSFKVLERMVDSMLPIPFGGLKAKKSFLYLDNLIVFISSLLDGEIESSTFNIADPEAVTLEEFVSLVAAAKGQKIRLVPMPSFILQALVHVIPTSYKSILTDDAVIDLSDVGYSTLLPLKWSMREGVNQSFGNLQKPC